MNTGLTCETGRSGSGVVAAPPAQCVCFLLSSTGNVGSVKQDVGSTRYHGNSLQNSGNGWVCTKQFVSGTFGSRVVRKTRKTQCGAGMFHMGCDHEKKEEYPGLVFPTCRFLLQVCQRFKPNRFKVGSRQAKREPSSGTVGGPPKTLQCQLQHPAQMHQLPTHL